MSRIRRLFQINSAYDQIEYEAVTTLARSEGISAADWQRRAIRAELRRIGVQS